MENVVIGKVIGVRILQRLSRINVLDIPKIIYINFRTLPFKKAVKFPIYISYKVKVGKVYKNVIDIEGNIKPFMIRFGFPGSNGVIEKKNGWISFGPESKIKFKGKASFACGCSIRVDSGILEIGENFCANKNCFISCNKSIRIGKDVLLGWDIGIRDSDGHYIVTNGNKGENVKDVTIGNHVWICSHVNILKGTIIGSDSVISYNSCAIGEFKESNLLIGGYPAKILKSEINWEQ